jgi:hypothetical protein
LRVARPDLKQVLKLFLNSIYGKLAQSVGGGSRFSSRLWAGMITSHTREQILRLISAHADEGRLYGIATDGIFSSEHFPELASDELGGWEVKGPETFTFVRPGIYWTSADAVKARGVGKRRLEAQLTEVAQAIAEGADHVALTPSKVFGGARDMIWRTPAGVYRRGSGYGEWFEVPGKLSLLPGPKRDRDWSPPRYADPVESSPYMGKSSPDARALKIVARLLHSRR